MLSALGPVAFRTQVLNLSMLKAPLKCKIFLLGDLFCAHKLFYCFVSVFLWVENGETENELELQCGDLTSLVYIYKNASDVEMEDKGWVKTNNSSTAV